MSKNERQSKNKPETSTIEESAIVEQEASNETPQPSTSTTKEKTPEEKITCSDKNSDSTISKSLSSEVNSIERDALSSLRPTTSKTIKNRKQNLRKKNKKLNRRWLDDEFPEAILMVDIEKALHEMVYYQKFNPECKIEIDSAKQKKRLKKERRKNKYLNIEMSDKLQSLENQVMKSHRKCELAEMMNYIYKMLSNFRDDLYMKTFSQFKEHHLPFIVAKEADTVSVVVDLFIDNQISKFECKYRNGLNFMEFEQVEDLQRAWKILRGENIPFFFFDPRDAKYFKVVIKGIPAHVQTKQVLSHLVKSFPVQYVHRMSRGSYKLPLPFVLVQIMRSQDDELVFCINSILGYSVTVEPLKKSDYPTQCFKCQGFFHAARWCRGLPKCVKCGEDHLSVACVNPTKVMCANCGGRHTANYKLCPVFIEQRERYKYICMNRVPTTIQSSHDFYWPDIF